MMATTSPITGWAIRFPEGDICSRWIYDTKKQAKEFAPGEIFGDVSNWNDAKKAGYRIVPVDITPRRPKK